MIPESWKWWKRWSRQRELELSFRLGHSYGVWRQEEGNISVVHMCGHKVSYTIVEPRLRDKGEVKHSSLCENCLIEMATKLKSYGGKERWMTEMRMMGR